VTTQSRLPIPRSDWAFFLDIDGTLLDLAATPDAVEVSAGLRDCLGRLQARFAGAVALVSGRSIATIDRLFAPLVLAAAGQHGAEARAAGEYRRMAECPELRPIAAALEAFAADRPGLVVEDKGDSVAVHYRLAPRQADAAWTLARNLLADSDCLEVLPARMALDVKPRAITKGTAIEWLMGHAPFSGRIPVFAGDDVTDEDGFAAVNARGGISIGIGHREHSVAQFRVGSAASFRAWLQACAIAPDAAIQ